MDKNEYKVIENFMQLCMKDTVHDSLHVYRVLNYALQIVDTIKTVDVDVVIISSLLHDIGRTEEKENPELCHAQVGSEKAKNFLIDKGYNQEKAEHIAECILSHRHKKNRKPQTIEAEILYDADKLDLTGALGTARAILFGGQIEEPFYLAGDDGLPLKGLPTEGASLFREYNRKLKDMSAKFYTEKAKEIGIEHQKAMDMYFNSLFAEVNHNYCKGKEILHSILS